jgi:hypothetical protein
MRLRSASSSLPSSQPMGMETCTLRKATSLSKVLFLDWATTVVVAHCQACSQLLFCQLRSRVSTQSKILNINLILYFYYFKDF